MPRLLSRLAIAFYLKITYTFILLRHTRDYTLLKMAANGVFYLNMLVSNEISSDLTDDKGARPEGCWRDVFISHASGDIQLAQQICQKLEANNLRCWIAPRDIPAGSYPEQIDDGINNCRCLLLILSESSNHSKWVLREITTAANLNKVILTFRITEQAPRKGLRILTSDQQDLDAWESPPEQFFDQLVSMLRAACLASQIESKQQSPQLYGTLEIGDESAKGPLHKDETKRNKALWWKLPAAALAISAAAFGANKYLVQRPTQTNPNPKFAQVLENNPLDPAETADMTTLGAEPNQSAAGDPLNTPIESKTTAQVEVAPTEPSALDIARDAYEQQLASMNIRGWQPSIDLVDQTQETTFGINESTPPGQAVEIYKQATASLEIARQQYNAASFHAKTRLDQAKSILANHAWCEQCSDIQTLVGDLTIQLAAVNIAYSPTNIASTTFALDNLFTKIDEAKEQNASAITQYHAGRKASFTASMNTSEKEFARASGCFNTLKEFIKAPIEGVAESSASSRIVSLQADLCMITLEDSDVGERSLQAKMAEIQALADQTTPLSDADLAHASSIQTEITQTAALLSGYTVMLKAEFDARISLDELFILYETTPASSDKSTDLFYQSLNNSIDERDRAIRQADQRQSSFAMAAFSKLLADATDSISQNRISRYHAAHQSSVSTSDSIQQTYGNAFERGLRIPSILPGARAELKTITQTDQPSESDIARALNLSSQFQNTRLALDSLADQVTRVLHAPFPFHNAAQTGQVDLLNDFHALGVSVNIQRPTDMQSVLHIAAANNQLLVANWAVNRPGADLELQEKNGYTPLATAALNKHTQMVELLIRRNANVFPTNNSNITIVFERDVLTNRKMLFTLLDAAQESGRSVSAITGNLGRTLLIEIANAGGRDGLLQAEQIEIAQRLIAMGIDPKQIDNNGATARSIAVLKNAHTLARFLKDAGG